MGILISFSPASAVDENTELDSLEVADEYTAPLFLENTDSGEETNDMDTTLNKTYTVKASNTDTLKSQYLNSKGYWVWSSYASTINIASLKNQGFTDIYILTKGSAGKLYYSALQTVINKAKGTGVRVHAWIVCFKDDSKSSTGWIDPKNVEYQNYLLNIITTITKNYNVNGIHLDYVRYSGLASKNRAAYQQTPHGAITITDFVSKVYQKVKSIKSYVAVSAVLKAEIAASREYYGQDYGEMAKYLDLMIPMIYKSSYGKDTAWIGKTTKYIVEKSNGTPVLAGLENYRLSPTFQPLYTLGLNYDMKIAKSNGAYGSVIFRYGIVTKPKPKDVYVTNYFTKKEKKWYRSNGIWRYKWVYNKYMEKKYKIYYAYQGQWKYKNVYQKYIKEKYKKWYRYYGIWRYKWAYRWVRIAYKVTYSS